MTARVTAGIRAVQVVAARTDPTRPMLAGAIARALSMPLSSVSRLCSELVEVGMLERGAAYGSYRLGRTALELSGRAQAPYVRVVRAALTRITQETGETALLAASSPTGMQVTATVSSPWTLFSPAAVGEIIDDERSAIVRAAARFGDGELGDGQVVAEAVRGKCVEVAVPILEPGGACVAVLAVRLPVNRAKQGVANARRALTVARRALERRIDEEDDARTAPAPVLVVAPSTEKTSALEAAVSILRVLAGAVTTPAILAQATGLRRDRVQRLLDSCRRAGIVRGEADGERVQLEWTVHGWLRAAVAPTLVEHGTALVARAADVTGACAFITVLRGMRSVTLVEELRDQGEGLEMTPWLGRPCPITSADGGPTLVMDFPDDHIAAFLPQRADTRDAADFLDRVRDVTAHGVMAKESFEEAGQTAISAPVRDASGAVIAAACLVGATDLLKSRTTELEHVARRLSDDLSALLGAESALAPPESLQA